MKTLLAGLSLFSWVSLGNAQGEGMVYDDDRRCTLQCPLDAPCTFGDAPADPSSFHLVDDRNSPHFLGMHCACPLGWTGIMCDRKYESCNDTEGGNRCFHGGKCVQKPSMDEWGNTQLVCDCTNAVSSMDGTRYVGKYCETPFEKKCSQEDPELFCVNGGDCNPEFANDGVPCLCPDGWAGFHCEFKEGEVPDCTLDCQNGGLCVVGVRDANEVQTLRRIWSDEEISDHMRCLCPPGTGGPFCQATEEVCSADGKHRCYHGGACVLTTTIIHSETTSEYHCDCTTASDAQGNAFAGAFCQEVSTSFCDERDRNSFCTNGGTCPNSKEGPCSCPDGFGGHRCEFDTNPLVEDDADFDDDENDDVFLNDGEQVCGDLVCKNGGMCTTTVVRQEDGNGNLVPRHIQFCDCSTTATDVTIFAGPQCEHEATQFCTHPHADNPGGMAAAMFCVQGGRCKENPFEGCDCLPGWRGPRCEFRADNEDVLDNQGQDDDRVKGTTPCGDKVCYNGGVCTVEEQTNESRGRVFSCDCSTAGTPDEAFGGPTCAIRSTSVCSNAQDTNGNLVGPLVCLNHGTCRADPADGCDCPAGFYGTMCELEVEDDRHSIHGEPCGEGKFCYNGGKCVTSTVVNTETGEERVDHFCDCGMAFDDEHLYAGSSCQHKSTSLCTLPKEPGDSLQGSLFCVNGGTCNKDIRHGCACPPGWTGFYCEFPEGPDDAFQDIEDQEPLLEYCGDKTCLNGGKCITTTVEVPGGIPQVLHYCDCAMAFDDENIFAGPNCEYPATSICTESYAEVPDLGGVDFCVNSGRCVNSDNGLGGCECSDHWTGLRCEFPAEGSLSDEVMDPSAVCTNSKVDYCFNDGKCRDGDTCHCPSGFFGPRCELSIYDDEEDGDSGGSSDLDDSYKVHYFNCRLTCENGGRCVKGAKDHDMYENAVNNVAHLNETFDQDYFEHCMCPEGFVGLRCEHKVETCGNDEHFCLHGSSCVERKGRFSCDCDLADERVGHGDQPSAFAGDFCQHPATDICTLGGDDDYLVRPMYFCVNHGTCRAYVMEDGPDPGCDCPPGWIGNHCEIKFYESAFMEEDQGGPRSTLLVVIGATLFVGLFCFLVNHLRKLPGNQDGSSWCCMILRLRRRSKQDIPQDPTPHTPNIAPKRNSLFFGRSQPAIVSPSHDPDPLAAEHACVDQEYLDCGANIGSRDNDSEGARKCDAGGIVNMEII